MINDINILLKKDLIDSARNSLPFIDFKLSINEPSGDFFYDPWVIKQEYKSSVWMEILNTLPFELGEARLIKLAKGTCYSAHADIDDRWHVNIVQGNSFLIDIEKEKMHSLISDRWYDMDAGIIHSAVNFGGEDRVQLVVRKLLTNAVLQNPKKVEIKCDTSVANWRYVFDHVYSPLLNKLNKSNKLSEFKHLGDSVTFYTEDSVVFPENSLFEIKL